MTPGLDNEIVWLIKITDGTNAYRFATENITLSSNDWDGEVMGINQNRYSVGEIGKRINIIDGGTTGEISTITFTIARYTSNALTNDFFNEYYPATSGKILIGSQVDIGIIWNTSNDEADITWLYSYNGDDFNYNGTEISLLCSEFSDFEQFNIPYYKIQNETDNGMSYFPSCPKENMGVSIPIVYGNFSIYNRITKDFAVSPSLLIDKSAVKYIIASHPVFATSESLTYANEYVMFLYISEINNYLRLTKSSGSTSENTIRHSVSLQNTLGDLFGDIYLPFNGVSSLYTFGDVSNTIDNSEITFVSLDASHFLALRVAEADTSVNIGSLNTGAGSILVSFEIASNDANNRDFTINGRNQTLDTPASGTGASGTHTTGTTISTQTYDITTDVNPKQTSDIPWEINELLNLEYFIENNEVSAGNYIQVFIGGLDLSGIFVNKVSRKSTERGGLRSIGRSGELRIGTRNTLR